VERHRFGDRRAFAILRDHSRAHRFRLVGVAEAIADRRLSSRAPGDGCSASRPPSRQTPAREPDPARVRSRDGPLFVSTTETRHDLFVYEADDAFAVQIERFLVAGIDAGEHVLVVVGVAKQRLVRGALGSAAEFVSFADPGEIYSRPESAIATLDAAARGSAEALDPGFRVYGELPPCGTQAEWDGWMVYEAVVNRAFANRPASLMCGYDARVVPEAVVDQAWQTHRVVLTDVWQLSSRYEQPEDIVRKLAPPLADLPGLPSLPIGDGRLHERLADALSAAGVPAGRARDLLVAAREVLSNAELYGNGARSLRAGRVGEQFVCEVTDGGAGVDDPLAGYLPPLPHATRSAGLWIARQLTARLELGSGPGGFTVRLWI
jgi:anti-sigma regulatory factor (Ser/Thr protein kinase)